MNRRGFLGFFGGAAAAAPKLAAGIADRATGLMPMYSGLGLANSASVTGEGENWRVSRIAKLRAIISHGDPRAKQEDVMSRLCAAENRERLRLDSLRSVSPAAKFRMLAHGEPERRDRIRRQDAKFDLFNLLNGDERMG